MSGKRKFTLEEKNEATLRALNEDCEHLINDVLPKKKKRRTTTEDKGLMSTHATLEKMHAGIAGI